MTTSRTTEEEQKRDPGYKEVYGGLQFTWPEQFVVRIGMRGLNWIIREVLDRHYPADIFPADILYPTWASNQGGDDIDPGVKWVAFLRAALKEVE